MSGMNFTCCWWWWTIWPLLESWTSDVMLVMSVFAKCPSLFLLLLLPFKGWSISLLLLIGDGTCRWLYCVCCSCCELLKLFCWWLLFVTWLVIFKNKVYIRKSKRNPLKYGFSKLTWNPWLWICEWWWMKFCWI